MRTVRYQTIADALRTDVVEASFPPGGLLPSEKDLSERFKVSRVTVRRALELLREEGLVDARQGFGWFVATAPVRQSLAHLATIEDQMASSGLLAERQVLEFGFQAASVHVQATLGCDQVLRVRRLNLADGAPFAVVTVWCPADVGQHLSRADVERLPFYELLPTPLGSATQTIGAAAASASDAALLEVPVGSPVLRCERVTRDADGHPVLFSEHVFAGHRTEFVVDLSGEQRSIAPSGLRLVAER